MVKYKLAMVEERTERPMASKSALIIYKEVATIGYFDSEKSLAKWAEGNDGCLAKENKSEET